MDLALASSVLIPCTVVAVQSDDVPPRVLAVVIGLLVGALVVRRALRSCRVLPTGLRVNGILRAYDVPWGSLDSVSWDPFLAASHSWRWGRVWVSFTDGGGRRRNVPVCAARMDRTVRGVAQQLWDQVPDAQRTGVALYGGRPVAATALEWLPARRSAPAVDVDARAFPVARDDARWGWVQGHADVHDQQVSFTVLGRREPLRLGRLLDVQVDIGSSVEAPSEVVVTLLTAHGRETWRVDRRWAGALAEVLTLARAGGSPGRVRVEP